jgi:hypothetical protein
MAETKASSRLRWLLTLTLLIFISLLLTQTPNTVSKTANGFVVIIIGKFDFETNPGKISGLKHILETLRLTFSLVSRKPRTAKSHVT